MGGFAGFGPKALAFFTALKFHQDKAWFEDNRALYQSDVFDPMVALLDDLTAAFAANKIPLKAQGKRSVFRIHRDVRFAKDKSPYKTHCGATLTRFGGKLDQGLVYLHIDPEGCFMAAGFHMLEPAELAKLRQAIVAKPARLQAMEKALAKGGLALTSEFQLSRVPRGFEALKGGPLDSVIRLKSFLVEAPLSEAEIRSPQLTERVVDFTAPRPPAARFRLGGARLSGHPPARPAIFDNSLQKPCRPLSRWSVLRPSVPRQWIPSRDWSWAGQRVCLVWWRHRSPSAARCRRSTPPS